MVLGMQREQTPATLVSADARLVHLAQASAVAVGASLAVVGDPEDLRALWRASPAVLIGSDQIEKVVTWALPRREQVYLVGHEGSYQDLCRWSVPLGACVIQLPDGNKWLSRVIAGHAASSKSGIVVGITPGVPGVGASTLCVGLGILAQRRSMKVALVDCDDLGGGLDLILGAENTPGWRWDKLRNAAGQIADIGPMLPSPEGITLVSMERADPQPVPGEALEAVVDCLARTHDLVLVDLGRAFPGRGGMIRRAVVVSSQTVRGIAATRASLSRMDAGECGLVVRKSGSVSSRDAARTVDLPLISVAPTVPDLARLADRGIPPTLSGGWKKCCTRVLHWCLGEPGPRRGR